MIGVRRFCCCAVALLALLPAAGRAQSFYRLESATVIPGASPNWDYVAIDPDRSFLFIGRRQDGVQVYDIAARKVIHRIENSEGADGAVLVPEFDRGYSANEDGSTTVFALSSLKTITRTKFGDDADAAFYDPATKQIVLTQGDSKQLAFLDARTGKVTAKIKMASEKLEGTAADGKGLLFVAERDRNLVARIDAAQHAVTAEWPIDRCEQPTGLAMDRAQRRLFVGCRGKAPVLAVLDADSGKTIAALDIGRGNDGVVYDPDAHRIYTSNGIDANLVIIDQKTPDTYVLEEASTTRPGARTMALDPKTKDVYMVTAEGAVDPTKPVNRSASPFYPNTYFSDTFTVLTFARR
ncbi:MAG TPA: YncE family protein [Alphaproteobacteria bacterium]|nr:YncE family protein [Alphaproteobacteria bacterium]